MTTVLHILPHPGGGGEVYVSTLSSTRGFSHRRFYLSASRTPASAALSLPLRLPALAREARRADILHVHGDVSAILTLPVLATKPSVITTHGLHLLRRSTGPGAKLVRGIFRRAVARSSAVISTSTAEANELADVVRRQDRAKIRVVLNGVRAAQPITRGEREQLRQVLGAEPCTVLGLFAGELESRKEPLLAADAAIRVNAEGIPFMLVFAGEGALLPALKMKVGSAVKVLGFRRDLDRLMSAADAFVHPSSREGMSLALLEAMSHGLPVVAADAPGNTEAVSGAGLTFATGDERALANTLAQLADHSLRTRLGSAAKRRARERFGVDRFVTETAAVYASLVPAHVTRT